MANEAPTQDAGAGILATAKSARALSKRSLELSAADTLALCAEPVLEALGWDIRNPTHVRRGDSATLRLMEGGKPAMSIHALAVGADMPDSISANDETDWVAVTNGIDWALFSQRNPSKALRKVSLATAASAKEGLDTLLMLQQGKIRKGELSETFAPAVLDESVAKSLARHLEGSEALISAIVQDLESEGIRADADEVRAALGRRSSGSVAEAVAASADEPQAEDASAEATPARSSGRAKSAAKKKPAKGAAAKKASTRKPSTRTTAKSAGSKAKSAASTEEADSAKEEADAAPSGQDISDTTPAATGWPKKASHVMQRKQVVAYMDFDKKSGKATLLPGSVLNKKMGKSLNPGMLRSREQSLEDGSLEVKGDMVVLTVEMEFANPRLAATFAAATLVKDMSAWRTRKGDPLVEPGQGAPAPQKAESAPAAEAPQSSGAEASETEAAMAG